MRNRGRLGRPHLLLAALGMLASVGSPAAPNDFSSFRAIADKNIFDSARSGRGAPPPPPQESRRPPQVDAFTLVGTMEYEKGPFAFFDGTSPAYQQVLPPGGTIAGFRITAIASQYVKLEDPTNQFELRVGAQLRREDDGPWLLREQGELLAGDRRRSERSDFGRRDARDARGEDGRRGESRGFDNRRGGGGRGNDGRGGGFSATPSPSTPSTSAVKLTPAEEEEILKRLMQQREQETK